jgi:ATP-binding cassette, subfamily F, member 2
MASNWHQKKARLAEIEFERQLQRSSDDTTVDVVKPQALGVGDQELFEKKLSKDEKKALAKAKREAKRKSKNGDGDDGDDDEEAEKKIDADALLKEVQTKPEGPANDGMDHEAADRLASAGTICTFAASRKGLDHSARDINIQNFTMQHMGSVLLDETEIVLNHGNRYGLIGRNGAGKTTLLKVIGSRAVPIPNNIDLYYLEHEIEPSDTLTALDAVMSVDAERARLEQHAETLNTVMAELTDENNAADNNESGEEEKTLEEKQEEIMEAITMVYERLDALDASTAEVRARQILRGLGFTHEMQGKKTKEFSGGWRMRVSLARALFIQPMCLVLDGPTSHLEYVI